MPQERRLAAILVADVVGFSRLIGADETGTLARLNALRREVTDPLIAGHGGRLFKQTGDGFLVEFASAVQAVTCARAIQDKIEDGPLCLRIGIHLGDVVVQGDDLLGDGVNIAARLEGVAEPGGIALSRQVHDQVRDRIDAAFDDRGEVELKNIARPVHVFALAGGRSAPALQRTAQGIGARGGLPVIAVLPFQNRSSDPEQEYFSDGITEDIITSLSKFRAFHVIARNTTFAFKGNTLDVAGIGRALKADYLVEGSVRSLGNRVRITAQLIDVAPGTALWAERYDREFKDVFEVQDEITARIAAGVDPAIRGDQTRRALSKHPADLKAWDHLLRGLWHLNRFRKDANAEARREFASGVERDPRFAPARAWLAMTYVFEAWFNWTDGHGEQLERAGALAAEAVRLDDSEPMSHVAAAMSCFWTGRMEQAKHAAERALALNPNSFLANFVRGGAGNYSGLCEAAVPYHLKALDLSPSDPLAWNCLGSLAHTYLNLGKVDDAVACADRALVQRHGYLFARLVKIAALGHAGRIGDARTAVGTLFDIAPDFSLGRLDHYPFVLASQKDHLLRGLALAGLSSPAPASEALAGPTLALPDKPSIAVLPFQNMSGDPEQEYFADGIVEDIITALSRFKSLFVIARNSSFTYKGKAVDIKQVGRELGVRYVLEGSVRRASDRVRITGQLIEAASGTHLWADRFDGGLDDVFDLQDRVTGSIVGAIAPKVEQAEIERARYRPAGNFGAYDSLLRALARLYELTGPATDDSLALIDAALDRDPRSATAHALKAFCYSWRFFNGWMADATQECAQAERHARRALELGGDDAAILAYCGYTLASVNGQIAESADLIDRALELNPNLALGWAASGWLSVFRGKTETAIEHAMRALRLSPIDVNIQSIRNSIAQAHFLAGRPAEAVSWARLALQAKPRFAPSLRLAAAAEALLGNLEAGRKYREQLQEVAPAANLASLSTIYAAFRPEHVAKLRDGLAKAGLPE